MSPITIGSTSCGQRNWTHPSSNTAQGKMSRFLSTAGQLSGSNSLVLLLTYRTLPLQSENVFSRQVKSSHSKTIGLLKHLSSSSLAKTTLILTNSTYPPLGGRHRPLE